MHPRTERAFSGIGTSWGTCGRGSWGVRAVFRSQTNGSTRLRSRAGSPRELSVHGRLSIRVLYHADIGRGRPARALARLV